KATHSLEPARIGRRATDGGYSSRESKSRCNGGIAHLTCRSERPIALIRRSDGEVHTGGRLTGVRDGGYVRRAAHHRRSAGAPLIRANIDVSAGSARETRSALISDEVKGTAKHGIVAGVEGRAAREQRLSEGRSPVGLQRPEHRITGQEWTAAAILNQVVIVGGSAGTDAVCCGAARYDGVGQV